MQIYPKNRVKFFVIPAILMKVKFNIITASSFQLHRYYGVIFNSIIKWVKIEWIANKNFKTSFANLFSFSSSLFFLGGKRKRANDNQLSTFSDPIDFHHKMFISITFRIIRELVWKFINCGIFKYPLLLFRIYGRFRPCLIWL